MKYWINVEKDAIYAQGNLIWAWDVEFDSIGGNKYDLYVDRVSIQGQAIHRENSTP